MANRGLKLGNSIDEDNNGSCPDFMHNYLEQSTQYGGSYDDTTSIFGYWTMSAYSGSTIHAWCVMKHGTLSGHGVENSDAGARAVVEINK